MHKENIGYKTAPEKNYQVNIFIILVPVPQLKKAA
jgi:hypothetical protein